MSDKDFLDEVIADRESRSPGFRALVEAARDRRRMLRQLADERKRRGITQTELAAVMGTSQSSVARIEAGKADVRLSTLERYAASLGQRVQWRLAPAAKEATERPAPARRSGRATVPRFKRR